MNSNSPPDERTYRKLLRVLVTLTYVGSVLGLLLGLASFFTWNSMTEVLAGEDKERAANAYAALIEMIGQEKYRLMEATPGALEGFFDSLRNYYLLISLANAGTAFAAWRMSKLDKKGWYLYLGMHVLALGIAPLLPEEYAYRSGNFMLMLASAFVFTFLYDLCLRRLNK